MSPTEQAYELLLDSRAVTSDAAAAISCMMNIDGNCQDLARREAQDALTFLFPAVKLVMEMAGFDPDETERGQLYRAIVNYIEEERLLGDASGSEEAP